MLYNLYLIRRYKIHINVEICALIQIVKYIYKYIYKSFNRITLQLQNNDDKIVHYLQNRYIKFTKII